MNPLFRLLNNHRSAIPSSLFKLRQERAGCSNNAPISRSSSIGAYHPRIRAEWYAPMEPGIMGAWRCYNRYAPMGLEGEMPNVLHESKQHKPYLKLSHYLLFIHLSLYFKALLSTLTGGVMCLLFGRLDSKFVRTPPWFLFMIYSYAAIHVGDVVFGQPGWEVFEVAVIVLMLIFKAALYLFVAWIINSGRLLFYFVKVQRVQEHEGRDWVTFQKLLSPGAQGE